MDSEIALALARLGDSTDRLLATAGALDDAQAAAASRLPGWTRGHVLTHLARNADGFRNLLIWARTGTETPMYPSEESRDRDIEAGARRPAAELTADVRASAAAFATAAGNSRQPPGTHRWPGAGSRSRPGRSCRGGCPSWRSITWTWARGTGRATGPLTSCR